MKDLEREKMKEEILKEIEREKQEGARKNGLSVAMVEQLKKKGLLEGYNLLEIEVVKVRKTEMTDGKTGEVSGVMYVTEVKEIESKLDYEIWCEDEYGQGLVALLPIGLHSLSNQQDRKKAGKRKGIMSKRVAEKRLLQNESKKD